MSDSFISLYEETKDLQQEREVPYAHLLTRDQIRAELIARPRCDVVVVGGGVSSLLAARDMALQGARVLVLDPGYFGQRSVSWRSQYLRALYTRPGDLVRSVLRYRSFARTIASQIVTSSSWSSPRPLAGIQRLAAWVFSKYALAKDFHDLPSLDERLLVRELALSARQEGALVLSSAEAGFVERNAEDGGFRIGVVDRLSGDVCEITARALIVDPGFVAPLASRLGTQLFKAPSIERSALALILDGVGSETSPVMSLRVGGIVGTFSAVGEGTAEIVLFFDAETPAETEISGVVEQLCAAAEFRSRSEVARWWCGHRYGGAAAIAERRGAMVSEQRVPWDSGSLSQDVAGRALSYVDGLDEADGRLSRELPGDEYGSERGEFTALATKEGISSDTIKRVVARWRGRVRYLDRYEGWSREVCPGVLKGEVALAVASDQISSLEDLVFGSLAIHYLPAWRESLPALANELSQLAALPSKAISVERALAAMRVG